MQTYRAAVAGTLSEDPYRPGRLANLGTALEAWYERTGDAGALREAAESIRGAIAAVPAGRPARADYLSNLGATLQRLFERTMEHWRTRSTFASGQPTPRPRGTPSTPRTCPN